MHMISPCREVISKRKIKYSVLHYEVIKFKQLIFSAV